ncbi:ABC transporter substrate-binding protein [Paenibacillus taichungensis]|uniref:ABC transporter substrate-binding protein n=1 Tax=Paenibacillus taichungensis TaxID=484184 RepID=UPI0035E18EE4
MYKKLHLKLTGILLVFTMLLVACSQTPATTSQQFADGVQSGAVTKGNSSADSTTKTVESANGSRDIPAKPERIVSINMEDILLSLEVPLVLATPIGRQDYLNEQLKAQGVTVEPINESVNFEAVISANPDLIIANASLDSKILEQLDKIAPTITYDRRNWQESIVQIAEALDIEDKAEQLLQKNKDQVSEAQQRIADITKTKPTAAFLRLEEKDMRLFFSSILSTPFSGSSYVGAGYEMGFTPDSLVAKLEAENPERMNANISVELLPEIQADYLFIVSISSDGSDEALQKTKDELSEIQQLQVWKSLPAVQSGHVYVLNAKNWLIDGPVAESLKRNEMLEVLGLSAQ